MPYIVKATRFTDSGRRVTPAAPSGVMLSNVLSDIAVASLGRVKAYTSGLVEGIIPWPSNVAATRAAAPQVWNMPEEGGRIGPLPDGTTIEVERVPWLALGTGRPAAVTLDDEAKQEILDRYNGRATA